MDSLIYIDVKVLKTYAWINATAISSTVINRTIAKGKMLNTANSPPAVSIVHVNPANIANSKCPAVILAANRTPKDTALAVCDTSSIITMNGANAKGLPAGINIEKYSDL